MSADRLPVDERLPVDVYRLRDDGIRTFGVLWYGEANAQYTLERPWLDNREDVSCVPPGPVRYDWEWSSKDGGLGVGKGAYRANSEDTGGRDACLIHTCNLVSQITGCTGVGRRIGRAEWLPTREPAILGSRDGLADFLAWAKKRPLLVTYHAAP